MPSDQSPRGSYVLDRGYAQIPRRPRSGPCPEQFRYQASGVEGPTSHTNDSRHSGEAFSTVAHQPNLLGHIGQTLNARGGCAYATCPANACSTPIMQGTRGFRIESTADVLLTQPPT
jgi:hypothetical protein